MRGWRARLAERESRPKATTTQVRKGTMFRGYGAGPGSDGAIHGSEGAVIDSPARFKAKRTQVEGGPLLDVEEAERHFAFDD